VHDQADLVSAACCEQVPAGHVWLQGDNTLNSTDSRHYGPVPYALLKGRAFCKVRCGDSALCI
jgi:type IV secretory pathway protease TraF